MLRNYKKVLDTTKCRKAFHLGRISFIFVVARKANEDIYGKLNNRKEKQKKKYVAYFWGFLKGQIQMIQTDVGYNKTLFRRE